MLDHIIQGILMAGLVRQLFVNRALAQQIWDNEVAFYSLAAQCRGLANVMGYEIVTPSLDKREI